MSILHRRRNGEVEGGGFESPAMPRSGIFAQPVIQFGFPVTEPPITAIHKVVPVLIILMRTVDHHNVIVRPFLAAPFTRFFLTLKRVLNHVCQRYLHYFTSFQFSTSLRSFSFLARSTASLLALCCFFSCCPRSHAALADGVRHHVDNCVLFMPNNTTLGFPVFMNNTQNEDGLTNLPGRKKVEQII